jgi:predicted nuclease of predicted toxin-antitoxin system
MKLLFDQNLSHRLVSHVSVGFPGSTHVRLVGLQRAKDSELWTYAATNGFAIVSKDADFQQRSMLMGHPPKVIWIRSGNCLTQAVAALLLNQRETLLAFDADPSATFIALA